MTEAETTEMAAVIDASQRLLDTLKRSVEAEFEGLDDAAVEERRAWYVEHAGADPSAQMQELEEALAQYRRTG